MRAVSSIPLEWSALLERARRHWLPDHQGEIFTRHRDGLPSRAPVAIAACALLAQRQSFATEREAELYRWLSPKAQNVVTGWRCLRMDLREIAEARGIGKTHKDLRNHWRQYLRNKRHLADRIEDIRFHLTPRPRPVLTVVPAIQAAE